MALLEDYLGHGRPGEEIFGVGRILLSLQIINRADLFWVS